MEKVRETDFRRLDYKALSELRRQGFLQVQDGTNPEIVTIGLGFNRTTIYDWLVLFRSGGWDALKAKRRGGCRRKLIGKAMAWIHRVVTMKGPLQMKFAFALWTISNNTGWEKESTAPKGDEQDRYLAFRKLQRMPEIIRAFFRKPSTIWAAA